MLLEKNTSVNHLEFNKLLVAGLTYVDTRQWALAYTCFSYLYQNTKNKSTALLYNMALCHHAVKEYSKAIAMLGEAQIQVSKPSVLQNSTNHLPIDLLTDEYENSFYRLALNETSVALNINLIKLRIRRFLVDNNLALENWKEIIRLSALPEMDKCKNVREALAIARSKTNT